MFDAREAARRADELEASQQTLQQQAARIIELEGQLQSEVERRQEAEQAERETKATARALQQTTQERDQAREGQHQAEALAGELRVKVARLETERAALERSLEKADRQVEGLMERLGQGRPSRKEICFWEPE